MRPLVFDSSALSAFARAGLLPLLEQLTANRVRFVPRAVLDELRRGAHEYPELLDVESLPWLQTAKLDDSLAAITVFAEVARRIVVGDRNLGEASVLAWAVVNDAIAVIDDQDAVQCAHNLEIKVSRSLALIATALRSGLLKEPEALDALRRLADRGGARFPCTPESFLSWARTKGLL